MSRRRLSDDERTLWTGVTRSIAPLRRSVRQQPDIVEPSVARAADTSSPSSKAKLKPKTKTKPAPATAPIRGPAAPPPLAPLGRRLKQRISRGARSIDGRLDLHGMTQAQAHDALRSFLRAMQARGGKVVLVITGKGIRGGGDPYSERGVLKRQVPLWLQLPEFRSYIVGFESAGIGHGGEGALYVSLRKARGD
jgi:DNA-nicking Smr family endonuclease